MGSGGRMNTMRRAPHSKPPFTLRDIKKAIPPHCFNRSLLRSSSYAVYDLLTVAIFYYIATTYIPQLPYSLSCIAWPAYWLCQGSVMTGVWMVAHECGHHAFSVYQWIDDTVGLILHSTLLTPYFSWKYSHRRHHANTSSLENDEVYVPKVKSKVRTLAKFFNNPLGRVFTLAFQHALGWPFYLMFNIAGKPYSRFASHFDPYAPMYNDRERFQIAVSDAGVLTVVFVLYRMVCQNGISWVFFVYGGPLLVMNGLIVLITYLHHTHASLPRYDSSEWDWLRGALATVDRDFGILSKVFHNISDTHVLHHLFSTIPHYHAMEATIAIMPVLGEYYQIDTTPILKALWREATECIYVESEVEEGKQKKGVYWYKNKL